MPYIISHVLHEGNFVTGPSLRMWLLSLYESAGPQYPKITQQDRQLSYQVRIRHIRVTIVAVEKEELLHILSVCL